MSEIERLREAKTAALKIADERSRENVELQAWLRLLEEKIEAQRCEMRGER